MSSSAPLVPLPSVRVTSSREADRCILLVAGEIDVGTVEPLETALVRAAASPCHTVVVDLDGVTFMGASALGALVTAGLDCAARGGTLRVSTTSPRIRRLLAMTDLSGLLAA